MKKKLLMLALAAMLTLSATACGSGKDTSTSAQSNEAKTEESTAASEEVDALETASAGEDVIAASLEKMNTVTNMKGQMIMEMDMNISADGQSQAIESVTTVDMTFFSDPMKIKMEMFMDMGELGSAQESIYGEIAEDGVATMYMYDGTSWQSAVVSVADMMQYDANNSMMSLISGDLVYTLEGMEEVNGANAHKYSCVTSGEEAKQQLLSSGALDSFTALGIDANQLEGLLDNVGDMTEYVWIDQESLYPVKYEADMTQIVDTMMTSLIESMGEQAEGIEIHVSKMKVSMICSDFNNATDFIIPEEAKAE